MNISASSLRGQHDRVVHDEWWPLLEAAAAEFFPDGEFDAVDLFAIGSRETNWARKYLAVPGDNGNGFGLMQVDRRSYPEWVRSGQWRIPRESIRKGAEVLREKFDATRAKEGETIRVTWKGKILTVAGKVLTPTERKAVALAAYNSGQWAHYHISRGRSPDHGTTGKDYSADVLGRAATARPWAPNMKVCPTCHGKGVIPA